MKPRNHDEQVLMDCVSRRLGCVVAEPGQTREAIPGAFTGWTDDHLEIEVRREPGQNAWWIRRATTVVITFRYRGAASSFLCHVEGYAEGRLRVVPPTELLFLDLRRHPRVPVTDDAPVTVEIRAEGAVYHARAEDLSAAGVRCAFAEEADRPSAGTRVSIVLRGAGHVVQVDGLVVRTGPRQLGILVRSEAPEERAAIHALVQAQFRTALVARMKARAAEGTG